MITFFWLVMAGALWLIAIQVAGLSGFPPQIVTLARSSYIGTFSIFLMLELRNAKEGNQIDKKLSYTDFIWLMLPLTSVFALSFMSTSFVITPFLVLTIGAFYLCQLSTLIIRDFVGHIKHAIWDLLPPVLLMLLIMSHYLSVLLIALALLFIFLFVYYQSRSGVESAGIADSLIMQIPSICIAPVILVLIRDHVNFGADISRANIETVGMLVNGVGAALWASMVMRIPQHLYRLSILLWLAGFALALVTMASHSAILDSMSAILVAELLRGSLWLGMTAYLSGSNRWTGFFANLVGTALPVSALWISSAIAHGHYVFMIYAAFHVLVPLLAFLNISSRLDRTVNSFFIGARLK